jgi:hypothetical protein
MTPLVGTELRIAWAYVRGASGLPGVLTWCVEPRGESWVARVCTEGAGEPSAVEARVACGPGGELVVTTAGGELRAVIGGGESRVVWYATTTAWGTLGVTGGCYEAPGVEITRAEVGQPG